MAARSPVAAAVAAAVVAVALGATSVCSPREAAPPPGLVPFGFRADGHALRGWVTVGSPDADVLVVAHGGPGVSHDYTRPLARLASPTLRVAFWDQRGVGQNPPRPAEDHTLEGHVADLEALRAALGADAITVAGQSWGGLVALRYALAHPERVSALLLLDAVPGSAPELREAFVRFHARRRELAERGLIPAVIPPPRGDDCGPSQLALAPVYYHDPRHPLARSLGGSSCRDGVLAATWTNIGDYDLREEMASLPVPTLVLFGASDPFGPEMAADLARALPPDRLTVVELAECGHNGFNECPAPYFAAISAFLADARGGATTPAR